MNSDLKYFIENEIEYIDSQCWDTVFGHLYPSIQEEFIAILSQCKINIPVQLHYIPEYFYTASKKSSINIPNGVKSIHDKAFMNNGFTREVKIPRTVTHIGSDIFGGSFRTLTIIYDGTLSQWESIEKRDDWSYGTKLVRIKCSDGNNIYKVNN